MQIHPTKVRWPSYWQTFGKVGTEGLDFEAMDKPRLIGWCKMFQKSLDTQEGRSKDLEQQARQHCQDFDPVVPCLLLQVLDSTLVHV